MKSFFVVVMGIILGLFVGLARADGVISVGVGKGILSSEHGTPFERIVAVGYQHPLSSDFFVRPEAGYYFDLTGNGHKSGAWVAPLFGVRALSRVGPELHLGVGPGWISDPDVILGGHFQFSLEAGLGLSDRHVSLGVVWKHLSSAGIETPNQGRDFLMLQLRILNF